LGLKVFISYDHSEDVHYKRLLEAWDANSGFDFEFDNRSPSTAIDSVAAAVIKAVLTSKMKEATHLLVIVGAKTYMSKWVYGSSPPPRAVSYPPASPVRFPNGYSKVLKRMCECRGVVVANGERAQRR
jgi:hypothetical protein